MKITNISLKAFFLVFVFCGNLYSFSDFENALEKARTSNKRIIVDIYTDWCGWCKKMDHDVYGNSEIKKIIDGNFILVKLDAECGDKLNYNGKQYTEEELAEYFEATGYPTTVFLEPDGKLIEFKYNNIIFKNIPGYFKAKDFKKILNFIKKGKYKDSDLSKVI